MMRQVAIYTRALRDHRGISQEELADAMGISSQTIGRWERLAADDDSSLKSHQLADMMRYIGGAFEDLDMLITPECTDDQAQAIADRRFNASASERIAAAMDGLEPDEALLVMSELRKHPSWIAPIRGVLNALRNEILTAGKPKKKAEN